jgi:hypothetical protein
LILMGVWCGAHMADTTRKKTGMRLRPHVGRECARWNATEKSRQKLRQGEVLSLDRSLLMGDSKRKVQTPAFRRTDFITAIPNRYNSPPHLATVEEL